MSLTDRSYVEKRDFRRMQINSPVVISHENQTYQGMCKDLSGTGMMIETDASFTVGAIITVTIEQKGGMPFNAKVEVKRIEEGNNNQTIGLAIIDIQG